ncbi:MAG: (p)ppGpp synthetase [Candidatus Portnoybacteria bacterium CG10_big_fil_rev_8_21_14_0_10_36_7]|uniref:(P)ppGpp synthetase n=1 Tax=Candidatus Portnoybacteria bacterium CG10_big_fil_rev_8_21_14_0_10_36_7 TaxID=1974812 RepID=A0A2M8KE75_9BACT|nr:MAG: (p)ppGpp synthetase [Candidatus Portnoybacteria bacterium CG10_big_fil_rev_8_21_14_0_10_36_7]
MNLPIFLSEIKSLNPKADIQEIRKAYNFAKKVYGDTKRLSGQFMLDHCLDIAISVAGAQLDTASIQATIIHETIEKFNITRQEIETQFDSQVAHIVEGISNVGKVEHQGAKRSAENLRKLFLAMGEDIRVIIIKLINRTHGLETLRVFNEEKQKRIATETLEIYAPLANRLGMGKIQSKLEDMSFPYVYALQYEWLNKKVAEEYPIRQKIVEGVKTIITKELDKENIDIIQFDGRVKHLYSLWRKLQHNDMDMSRIYDLVALRLIVKDVASCYHTLGIIHKIYKPLHGRIKDYIASPKPNGYQSLHTTVFCDDVVEIQIRTPDMHKNAEYGIASHWYYDDEKKGILTYLKRLLPQSPKKEIQWIQELRKRQEKIGPDATDFENLKIDFFKDRIFVFTPLGDVFDLPLGSSTIDFAYRIHSNIGNTMNATKINDKMVPLNTKLNNGDIVEIITQKNAHPSEKWLQYVKTSIARNHIKKYLKSKNKLLENKIDEDLPLNALKTVKELLPKIKKTLASSQVEHKIKGISQILIKSTKCCHPKYPDKIIGYITATRGLTIHKKNCENMEKNKNKDRLFPLEWY